MVANCNRIFSSRNIIFEIQTYYKKVEIGCVTDYFNIFIFFDKNNYREQQHGHKISEWNNEHHLYLSWLDRRQGTSTSKCGRNRL